MATDRRSHVNVHGSRAANSHGPSGHGCDQRTCRDLRRRGPCHYPWTWAQSTRAGYDNPQKREGGTATTSPWIRFTEQMMKFKARNFVLRDTFGDILKGIKTREELFYSAS